MAGSSHFITFFILSISVCATQNLHIYPVGRCKVMHPVNVLSDYELLDYRIPEDRKHLLTAVKQILIPRAVGTIGHTQVRKYISNSLNKMGWSVKEDEYKVAGKVRFHNIIAKLNANAERFLVLACHYDSRYNEYHTIKGALDAVPCAMLLNMAHVLQDALKPFRETKLSLMFIFFDGREPPRNWDDTDYHYGAQHLADLWNRDGTLDKLDILVELDKIGLAGSTFLSYYKDTSTWFYRFVSLEERLSKANKLHCKKPKPYFENNPKVSYNKRSNCLPFLQQKVPILHLKPELDPYPEADNESIINYDVTEDISRIIRLFIMEYLLGGKKKMNV
ncbi:glutaminyl-peptide cyclotransferase-like [Eurosta solidaginis]|uniref:glutaminyl-peptide cyclotransferase-like n=1 Tax=Eurosta solidaginis TaxID=178769 RepID=UPI003530E376